MAWHKFVRKLDAVLAEAGGMARGGMDDLFPVGPADILFPLLVEFEREVWEHCGLELRWDKCKMFSWDGVLPPNLIPNMPLAGKDVNGTFEPGMMVYGVPVGTDAYVEAVMDTKMNEIARDATKACQLLANERQALWTTLRLSTQQKLDYWLMLVHPSQMKAAAARMDAILWDMLEAVVGAHLPRQDEGLGYESPLDIPVQNLTGRSFQAWMAQMPIRLGGLGLRCQADLAQISYISALEQSLPYFGGENGICQPLAHLGGVDEDGVDTRWRPLINSGCRTGIEMARAWEQL